MANTQTDLEKELELLKGQVAALTMAREQHLASAEDEQSDGADEAGEAGTGGEAVQALRGATAQLEELFDQLRSDIDETSTSTCLAVFTLGLLIGGALAR